MTETVRFPPPICAEALAAWFNGAGRRLNPGFPVPIEALFEADTARERLGAMKISTMAGCMTGVLVSPFLWKLLPDSHTSIIALWFCMAIPIGLLCHGVLWLRLSLARQEWVVALSGLAIGACFSAVLTSSHFAHAAVYLGGIILLTLLDAIAGGLRFAPACVVIAGLLLMAGATIPLLPGNDGAASASLIIILLNISGCAMFGNWRLETEIRRSWALALRERMARAELAKHNAELNDLAGRDALTGLANRRTYDRWLGKHWAGAAQNGGAIGLVIIDIDSFKAFNDYYGHAAGDSCLQTVASCLREQSRFLSDNVARLGGEEFAVLLPGVSLDSCGDVAERLRAAVACLEIPHLAAKNGAIVTVSCGAASMAPSHAVSAADLFAAADAALYAAKDAGRNCVRLGQTRHVSQAALG